MYEGRRGITFIKEGNCYEINRQETWKLLRDKSTRDLDLARYSENKIYISENLSQANKDLFKESLKVKKDLKYKFIWTFYGRTYLRKDSESPVVAILKKSDLDILKQDGGVHSANPNG